MSKFRYQKLKGLFSFVFLSIVITAQCAVKYSLNEFLMLKIDLGRFSSLQYILHLSILCAINDKI